MQFVLCVLACFGVQYKLENTWELTWWPQTWGKCDEYSKGDTTDLDPDMSEKTSRVTSQVGIEVHIGIQKRRG